MNGFIESRAAAVSRHVLIGSLLLIAASARGDDPNWSVPVSAASSSGTLPTESGTPRALAPVSQAVPARELLQVNAQSPSPRPFAPRSYPGQLGPSSWTADPAACSVPCDATTDFTLVAPNMVGDFLGGISTVPTILPGGMIDQAILIQPGVDPLLDHYRGLISTGGGTFDTSNLVYLGTQDGLPVGVVPTQLPPQMLQQFDGTLFLGDPATLGALTNAGPLIAVDSGMTGDVTTQLPLPAAILLNEPIFNIHDTLFLFVPSPGAGGAVGRQKIAQNSSPIPRDRVFIDHGTFADVPLTQRGLTVHRFSPGVEHAFFEQRVSVEVRFPFASTLDSDIGAGGAVTDTNSTQFGNITGTLKALVRRTPTSAMAVGLSVTAPTAKDITVSDLTGATLLSIENQSSHFMPFIGGTHTRGKWFSQWFVQGDIDATGSDVQIRNVLTGDLRDAGKMHDAAFVFVSGSLGYWIYQNGHRSTSFRSHAGRELKRTIYTGGSDGITGLAPFAELHYNRSLEPTDVISSGPVQVRSFSDFELTNLILGGVLTFGTGGSLTAAWGTPVLGQDDKQFEHGVRVTFDYEY